MPVYLLTLHGYGTWMPDRSQGIVHYRRGALPKDDLLNDAYRRKQRESFASFDVPAQQLMVNDFRSCEKPLRFTAYAAAADPSHLHLLLGWRDDRTVEQLRASIKHSLSRTLNDAIARRTWFARNGWFKQVIDAGHMAHLRSVYLPAHQGIAWDRGSGED